MTALNMYLPTLNNQVHSVTVDLSDSPYMAECGYSFKEITIQYESWGTLSANHDNVILLFHPLTGSAHAGFNDEEWNHPTKRSEATGWFADLIGPGKALDPTRYFILCPNLPGSCYGSTGPDSLDPSTHIPYGLEFPSITTRDMIHLLYHWLNSISIRSIHAAIGGSLGGMLVWEMGILYPNLCTHLIPIACDTYAPDLLVAYNHIKRQAILYDFIDIADGNPRGTKGLNLSRQIGMVLFRSHQSFEERFKRERLLNTSRNRTVKDNLFQVQNYLNHHGEKFVGRFSPISYLILTWASDLYDVSFGFSSLEESLNQIQGKVTLIGVDSDTIFPLEKMRHVVPILEKLNKPHSFQTIHSIHGHDGFLIEFDQLDRLLKGALA